MPATAVLITGTPGTGKTTITKRLGEDGYLTIDLFDIAKKYDCVIGRDEVRDSMIVDTDKLHDVMEKYLAAGYGTVIIDSHYADIVPDKFVSKAFVLCCNVGELRRRLTLRGYAEEKIQENLQAEIMQVSWTDALEEFGPGKVTKIESMEVEETVKLILDYLQSLNIIR